MGHYHHITIIIIIMIMMKIVDGQHQHIMKKKCVTIKNLGRKKFQIETKQKQHF